MIDFYKEAYLWYFCGNVCRDVDGLPEHLPLDIYLDVPEKELLDEVDALSDYLESVYNQGQRNGGG